MNLKVKTNVNKKKSKLSIEEGKYTLNLVNYWINNVDTKVSISCALFSIVFAVIVFLSDKFLSTIDKAETFKCHFFTLFCIFVSLTVISFVTSLYFHFKAIIPNFSGGKKTSNGKFSIFFEDINNFESPESYYKTFRDTSKDKFVREIAFEIYYNSCICSKKMHRFKMGVIFSIISIILVVVSSYLYYKTYS